MNRYGVPYVRVSQPADAEPEQPAAIPPAPPIATPPIAAPPMPPAPPVPTSSESVHTPSRLPPINPAG